MKTKLVAIGVVLVACSGATDPNPTPGLDGGPPSSSSGAVTTSKPDSGPRAVGPTATPGSVTCGASSCASPSVCCTDGATAECKGSSDECPKEVIACDELADCAQGRCCAEESTQTPMRFSTYCRPSCITNLPRVQVCVADEECASGSCQVYSCGGLDMKGVKTCNPLRDCK